MSNAYMNTTSQSKNKVTNEQIESLELYSLGEAILDGSTQGMSGSTFKGQLLQFASQGSVSRSRPRSLGTMGATLMNKLNFTKGGWNWQFQPRTYGIQDANPRDVSTETREALTTKNGKCRDCAQGILTPVHSGFEQYVQDGEPLWWFCSYCGSNHVEIKDSEGKTLINQGDNYE